MENNPNTKTYKFSVGDWIINTKISTACPFKVIDIKDNRYYLYSWNNNIDCIDVIYYIIDNNEDYRLWEIRYAKSGDVLINNNMIYIIKGTARGETINAGCIYNTASDKLFTDEFLLTTSNNAMPATKEEATVLFEKLKSCNYYWDSVKELCCPIVSETFDETNNATQAEQQTETRKYCPGDWIISTSGLIAMICEVGEYSYKYIDQNDCVYNEFHNIVEKEYNYRKWTMDDAQSGAFLRTTTGPEKIIILNRLFHHNTLTFCSYTIRTDSFKLNDMINTEDWVPANKKQCDLLLSKIKESGWRWDANKKAIIGLSEDEGVDLAQNTDTFNPVYCMGTADGTGVIEILEQYGGKNDMDFDGIRVFQPNLLEYISFDTLYYIKPNHTIARIICMDGICADFYDVVKAMYTEVQPMWRAKNCETYFYIDIENDKIVVNIATESNTPADDSRFNSGNYYQTKQSALDSIREKYKL